MSPEPIGPVVSFDEAMCVATVIGGHTIPCSEPVTIGSFLEMGPRGLMRALRSVRTEELPVSDGSDPYLLNSRRSTRRNTESSLAFKLFCDRHWDEVLRHAELPRGLPAGLRDVRLGGSKSPSEVARIMWGLPEFAASRRKCEAMVKRMSERWRR